MPEEGRRTSQPKRCGNNDKDEDNSLKTLNDKNISRNTSKLAFPYVILNLNLSEICGLENVNSHPQVSIILSLYMSWQIRPPRLNPCCIVWNWQQVA